MVTTLDRAVHRPEQGRLPLGHALALDEGSLFSLWDQRGAEALAEVYASFSCQ